MTRCNRGYQALGIKALGRSIGDYSRVSRILPGNAPAPLKQARPSRPSFAKRAQLAPLAFSFRHPGLVNSECLEGSYRHQAQSRSPRIPPSKRHTFSIRCFGDGVTAGGKGSECVCRYARSIEMREIEIPPSSDMVDSNSIPGLTPFDHCDLASPYRSLQLR